MATETYISEPAALRILGQAGIRPEKAKAELAKVKGQQKIEGHVYYAMKHVYKVAEKGPKGLK